jgi:nucleoside-diphosphate-sugar epimerase
MSQGKSRRTTRSRRPITSPLGLPVATVRLFNAYGPRVGQLLIIPTIIQQFLNGPRIKLGDLTPTRPFLYIRDIVEAFFAMAEAEGVDGQVIHFGGPESISMGELVQRIAKLMDITPEIEQDPTRMRPKNSEIHRQSVDGAKAARVLGWTAKVGMDEGLAETIAWIRAGGYEKRL